MSQNKRDKVFSKTGGECFYCRAKLHRKCDERVYRKNGDLKLGCFSPGKCFHVEHVTPKSQDGSNRLSNLVPSCKECNGAKGARNLFEFLARSRKQKRKLEKKLGLIEKRIENITNHILPST